MTGPKPPEPKPPEPKQARRDPGWWKALEAQQATLEVAMRSLEALAARLAAIEQALAPLAAHRPRDPLLARTETWAGPRQVSQAGSYKITDDPDHSPEAVAAIARADWEKLAEIRAGARREAAERHAAASSGVLWRTLDGTEVRDGSAEPVQVSSMHGGTPGLGAEPLPQQDADRQAVWPGLPGNPAVPAGQWRNAQAAAREALADGVDPSVLSPLARAAYDQLKPSGAGAWTEGQEAS